jgi:hypothetical protein
VPGQEGQAKQKSSPYVTDRESGTWFKIRNREYSQMMGREELFERKRHQEPVAGWHACAVACAELEEAVEGREQALARIDGLGERRH